MEKGSITPEEDMPEESTTPEKSEPAPSLRRLNVYPSLKTFSTNLISINQTTQMIPKKINQISRKNQEEMTDYIPSEELSAPATSTVVLIAGKPKKQW